MITTTLSSVPGGRGPYEAVGVVIGIANEALGMNVNLQEAARRQMEAQATSMGADAIIDVRLQMVSPGTASRLAIALIGTAIKFI
jgi:putative heavy-metal-binding protein